MISFLASFSWIGWVLIVLFLLTLWQLPGVLREISRATTGGKQRLIQPGEDPPHLGPGAHLYSSTSVTNAPFETDHR